MEEEIRELIEMVLDDVEQDEHVTDHVFCAIEKNSEAMELYRELVDEQPCGTRSINPKIGKTLKKMLGRESGERADASSGLTSTYTLLVHG